jgi:hypothetical protein
MAKKSTDRFSSYVAFGQRFNISITMSGDREPTIAIQDMDADFKVIYASTLEEMIEKLPIEEETEEEKKEESNGTG